MAAKLVLNLTGLLLSAAARLTHLCRSFLQNLQPKAGSSIASSTDESQVSLPAVQARVMVTNSSTSRPSRSTSIFNICSIFTGRIWVAAKPSPSSLEACRPLLAVLACDVLINTDRVSTTRLHRWAGGTGASTRLITASYDGSVRLLDIEKGVFDDIVTDEDSEWSAMDSMKDTSCIYVGDKDGNVAGYDARTKEEVVKGFSLHDRKLNTLHVSHPRLQPCDAKPICREMCQHA